MQIYFFKSLKMFYTKVKTPLKELKITKTKINKNKSNILTLSVL